MSIIGCLFASPNGRFFFPVSVMRIAFGLFFFASGYNKAFNPDGQALMLETISEAGIPFPAIMASFVAHCEVVFGMLLALGLFTRLGALVLLAISSVALVTVGVQQIPAGLGPLAWYSWLFYLPEPLYMLICLLLAVQGGGPFAVDQLIARRLARQA